MQPIDMQTLLTQMDKVGKTQILQKEGQQLQAALQHVDNQKKAEEQVRSVNQAQDMGYGTSKIKDENSGRSADHKKKPGEEGEAEEDEEKDETPKNSFFRDPALGRNIDLSC